MVCAFSQDDQSCITFGGGEETCEVMSASMIGTFFIESGEQVPAYRLMLSWVCDEVVSMIRSLPLAVLTRVPGIDADDSREVTWVQVIDQRGFAFEFEVRAVLAAI